MKQIILNIADKYSDVLTVTAVGGCGTSSINVICRSYDITNVVDKEIINIEDMIMIKAGGENEQSI